MVTNGKVNCVMSRPHQVLLVSTSPQHPPARVHNKSYLCLPRPITRPLASTTSPTCVYLAPTPARSRPQQVLLVSTSPQHPPARVHNKSYLCLPRPNTRPLASTTSPTCVHLAPTPARARPHQVLLVSISPQHPPARVHNKSYLCPPRPNTRPLASTTSPTCVYLAPTPARSRPQQVLLVSTSPQHPPARVHNKSYLCLPRPNTRPLASTTSPTCVHLAPTPARSRPQQVLLVSTSPQHPPARVHNKSYLCLPRPNTRPLASTTSPTHVHNVNTNIFKCTQHFNRAL